MNTQDLERFLLTARTKTYANASGKADSLLPGSVQYEFSENNFSYRDVYYVGKGIFAGLETVFYENKPVFSMSYFGDFSQMTEEQADGMLRKALMELWETTRIYKTVERDFGGFFYTCNGDGAIEKLSGTEEITVGGKKIYYFYYAGGIIG